MSALAARRRRPLATAVLVMVRPSWSVCRTRPRRPGRATAAAATEDESAAAQGCSSWPTARPATASNAEGRPRTGRRLIGVGAAAVDFQVGTGRMPLQPSRTAGPAKDERLLNDEEIAAAGRLRRLARPRPGDPDRGGARPADARPRRRRRALPHQLRAVPQLRRPGRRAHPRQVRPDPERRRPGAHLRGDAHRPAEHAGVQRRRRSTTEDKQDDHRVRQEHRRRQPNPGGLEPRVASDP